MTFLRRYPFETIANFRDLGGYAGTGGQTTRWGCFFRSARLCAATPQEVDALKALNIRTILDLRMPEEARMRPDTMAEDAFFHYRNLSLLPETAFDMAELERNPDAVPPMSTLYQYMLAQCGEGFLRLFDALAEGIARGGVLFHCTAGKDRTGLTAMFLLSLWGVDTLDIIADYEVSRTYNQRFMPEDTTGSSPQNMADTLKFLEEGYGGPAQYLRAVGVSEDALSALTRHGLTA